MIRNHDFDPRSLDGKVPEILLFSFIDHESYSFGVSSEVPVHNWAHGERRGKTAAPDSEEAETYLQFVVAIRVLEHVRKSGRYDHLPVEEEAVIEKD